MAWVALIDSSTSINGLNNKGLVVATQGTKVYVGGEFTQAGGTPANNIAVWDTITKTWSALGSGLNSSCSTIVISPDGLNVYVGGGFTQAGGLPILTTAVWNVSSQTWSKVGNGTHISYGLAVSNDNTKVYVGPWVWDIQSSTWSPLGNGFGNSDILKLSPDGTKLYAGGFGTFIGGCSANNIAVCDLTPGSIIPIWYALTDSSTGINGVNDTVFSITVSPDGLDVYASGIFTSAGGIPVNYISKWNTTTSRWSALGTGLRLPTLSTAITPDGTNLYASMGVYNSTVYTSVWNINTSRWSALNGDLNLYAFGLAINSDGSYLYVVGRFNLAGGITANRVVEYTTSGPPPPPPPPPSPVICFKEGTKILCKINGSEVYMPIQFIEENTLVKTHKHGYKKCKINMKETIQNTEEHSINNLYRLSRSNNSQLFEDLYITGSHSMLYDTLSTKEEEAMTKLIDTYNDKFDIKIHNKIDDKYKLIAYYDNTFVEVQQNIKVNIYHLVLENSSHNLNYGIYANGVLTESIDELSLIRYIKSGNTKIKLVNVAKPNKKLINYK